MNTQTLLERYLEQCQNVLKENSRVLGFLKKQSIYEPYIFDNFSLGYADGLLLDLIGENKELLLSCEKLGLIHNGKEYFRNTLVIPIYDENKVIVNLVGYNIHPQSKNRMIFLNESGIFNGAFISNTRELIFTSSPIESLFLIQHDSPNTTFLFGDGNN